MTASTPQPPNAWEHTPYIAKTLHLAEAALVDYLLSVFTSEEWQEAGGVKSFTHWITLRTGVSPSRARNFQLLINRAEELPTMMTAYRDAVISLDQAVAIATYTPTGYDKDVTTLGAKLTVTQLRRLLRNYTWPAEAAEDAPPAATTQTPPGQPDPTNTGPNPDRPATLNTRWAVPRPSGVCCLIGRSERFLVSWSGIRRRTGSYRCCM